MQVELSRNLAFLEETFDSLYHTVSFPVSQTIKGTAGNMLHEQQQHIPQNSIVFHYCY